MKYIVQQTFETLGDPCAKTFGSKFHASEYSNILKCAVAQAVSVMDTPERGENACAILSESDAWYDALAICGWVFGVDGGRMNGSASKYGIRAGECIAEAAVKIEEVES